MLGAGVFFLDDAGEVSVLIAEDAAEAVRIDYEPLTAVIDPRAAREKAAPLLHPEAQSNEISVRRFSYGDTGRAFEQADARVALTAVYPRNSFTPMECYVVVAEYCPDLAGVPICDAALDRVWPLWLKAMQADPATANADVQAIGSAFGALLVDRLGFEWAIGTDPWGTDLAVVAMPGTADVAVFPLDFVAKRFESGEPSFFAAALVQIGESLAGVRAEWSRAAEN